MMGLELHWKSCHRGRQVLATLALDGSPPGCSQDGGEATLSHQLEAYLSATLGDAPTWCPLHSQSMRGAARLIQSWCQVTTTERMGAETPRYQ